MYKVFFKDSLLCLANDDREYASDHHGLLIIWNDLGAVDDVFSALKKGPVFLVYQDINELMEYIFEKFKNIDAGGGLVFDPQDRLLMIYRLGIWDLPKGKREPEESIRDCALREVKEETGIQGIDISKDLEPSFHVYQKNGESILKKTYWFEMQFHGDERPVPQTEEGIEQVKWLARSEIKHIIPLSYPSLRDLLEQYNS